MGERDLWLATRLVELAESADADDGQAVGTGQITAAMAEVLAPAEVGLLLSDSVNRTVAGSSRRARDLVALVAPDLGAGGAELLALTQPVLNEAVEKAAARWPTLAAAARSAGFGRVSMLPLRRREQTVGVISVFSPGPHMMTASDIRLAEIFARAVGVVISQQCELRERTRAAQQLQRALDTRVLIEQAKGATAARLGVSPDTAFDLLRSYARRTSRPLADIARDTISGELPVHELVAPNQVRHARSAR
jgi:GAF domain-containing protein